MRKCGHRHEAFQRNVSQLHPLLLSNSSPGNGHTVRETDLSESFRPVYSAEECGVPLPRLCVKGDARAHRPFLYMGSIELFLNLGF